MIDCEGTRQDSKQFAMKGLLEALRSRGTLEQREILHDLREEAEKHRLGHGEVGRQGIVKNHGRQPRES